MDHLKAVNQKAQRIQTHLAASEAAPPLASQSPTASGSVEAPPPSDPGDLEVVALESRSPERSGPHIPLGCSLVFAPGWEVDSTGGTAGLCQPVERDLFDCHLACFWPAHVPDQLNHAPDWTGKCASAQKDWRKIDLIFP